MKTIVPLRLTEAEAEEIASRIWGRVRVTDNPTQTKPCWVYTGKANDGKGFRKVRTRGKKAYVHRVVWTCVHGDIPEGLVLDHGCRNRSCCNPDHLEPVTVAENTARGNGAWVYSQKCQEARRVNADRPRVATYKTT